MSKQIQLSETAIRAMENLEHHLAGITAEQLTETALCITAALYQKAADGARIKVEFHDGKTEELRFKVKRNKAKN